MKRRFSSKLGNFKRVQNIESKENNENMCEFVTLSERTKSDKPSRSVEPQYFWVPPINETIPNSDFTLLKSLAQDFELVIDTEEINKISNDYKFIEITYLKQLEKNHDYRILNALKYLIQMDQKLSINQRTHIRNNIKENPNIIELFEKRLRYLDISEIETLQKIMAFIDLIVDIFQLPKGENWLWVIQVLIVDIISLSEKLAKECSRTSEYKKIVVQLNLMFGRYMLLYSKKDLHISFRLIQDTTKMTMVNKNWDIPVWYLKPLYTYGLKTLNLSEMACILYYMIVININKHINNEDNDVLFEEEILHHYKLAIKKMQDNEPEESVLVLYELVSLSHKVEDKFMLCVALFHLSHAFFELRQTHGACLYLELVIFIAHEYKISILEILAHKQMAMIAGCQSLYRVSMFHFEKALEICDSQKNIHELLYEVDDIRTCLGEVIAKHKVSRGRISLDELFDVNLKCTCMLYEDIKQQ